MLDQSTAESFQRAKHGAVHHDHFLPITVGSDEVYIEAIRQVQVDLNGRTLPFAADGVIELDVDLRCVEYSTTLIDLIVHVPLLHGVFQRARGKSPLFIGAERFLRARGEISFVGISEGFHHHIDQIENAFDFTFQLLRRAEDVRVVLGKSADAQHAVQYSGTFIAIDSAQLCESQRQVTITAQTRFVDHDVTWTVHRFGAIRHTVDVHWRIHIFAVAFEVPAYFVELFASDVRRENELIATSAVLSSPEIFNDIAHGGEMRMPENQPWSDFIMCREQVELFREFSVVALFGFLQTCQICLEVVFAPERCGVNTLQVFALLVTAPVRTRNFQKLEAFNRTSVR